MRFTAWTAVSLVALLAGVVFYLTMGLGHGSWTDVGVYSVTVTLVGLGVLGALVSASDRAAPPRA